MIRYILPDYLVLEYTMVESSILNWDTILLIRMVIVEFTTLVYDTMFGIKLNPKPSTLKRPAAPGPEPRAPSLVRLGRLRGPGGQCGGHRPMGAKFGFGAFGV